MTKQASEGAMKAAESWFNDLELLEGIFSPEQEKLVHRWRVKGAPGLALIIDEHMQFAEPEWIRCEDRMPTEADGNEYGEVVWWMVVDHLPRPHRTIAPWDSPLHIEFGTHWFSLPPGPKEGK